MESNGHDPAEWLTIAQAAERAGVSADSVRRRLKRGQIPGRLVDTPYGPTWQVSLHPIPSSVAGDPPPAGAYPPSLVTATEGPPAAAALPSALEVGLLDRLDQMHHELLARTEAAAMWQARAEMLAGELADTRGLLQQRDETIRALMAPREEPDAASNGPEPASPTPDAVGTPPAPPRRPWYQRLLFG